MGPVFQERGSFGLSQPHAFPRHQRPHEGWSHETARKETLSLRGSFLSFPFPVESFLLNACPLVLRVSTLFWSRGRAAAWGLSPASSARPGLSHESSLPVTEAGG